MQSPPVSQFQPSPPPQQTHISAAVKICSTGVNARAPNSTSAATSSAPATTEAAVPVLRRGIALAGLRGLALRLKDRSLPKCVWKKQQQVETETKTEREDVRLNMETSDTTTTTTTAAAAAAAAVGTLSIAEVKQGHSQQQEQEQEQKRDQDEMMTQFDLDLGCGDATILPDTLEAAPALTLSPASDNDGKLTIQQAIQEFQVFLAL